MNKRPLNVAKKQADRDFCRFGNAQQGFNGNYFFAALDFTNVFGIQVSQFSQLFLRATGALAIKTNGVTDDSPMPQDCFPLFLRGCHNPKA